MSKVPEYQSSMDSSITVYPTNVLGYHDKVKT
jgi:hypothetical protein